MKARKSLTPALSHRMGEGELSSVGPRLVPLRVRVTAAAESIVRGGHPWVFAGSVRQQNRAGAVGELAVIFDRNDKFLAAGLFDPDSPIRVRVVHVGKPLPIDATFWRTRLEAAVRRRTGLFDEQTTGYRLINGESDGWPGLVLDRYETTLVMKIYTAAWLPRLAEVAGLIRERLNPERIVLRMSRNIRPPNEPGSSGRESAPFGRGAKFEPAHDGSYDSEVKCAIRSEKSHPGPRPQEKGEVLFSRRTDREIGAPVVFRESGLRFEVDVLRGQKTGFFLDQRENRRQVESLARGRTVLNAFSFSGGFSVYAARGGAVSVTDLDISAHALESARRNFKLNQTDPLIARARHELARADAFEWLAGNARRQFDLIVLDPPSLAKREAERTRAIRAYGKLAAAGLKHLRPNGILVACSCSAHVTAEEFYGAIRQSVARSGRKFVELRTTRHAPDHPAAFAEAEYLKAIYLRFA